MTKTEYLYGLGFDKTILEKQIEVCEYKLQRISMLMNKLIDIPFYARDEDRIDKLLKARTWNENLLQESKEMLKEKNDEHK